jgi:transglutaminase-like putative cysteine protease
MRYRVTHSTEFDYGLPVISAQQVLRLKPRELFSRQSLKSHDISLSIPGTEIQEILDYFGNTVHEVRLHTRHDKLRIDSVCEVDVSPRAEFLLDLSPPWESVVQAMNIPQTSEHWQAAQFCFPSRHVNVDAARVLAQQFAEPGLPLLRVALNINQHIHREFTYTGGVTDVYTEVGEVLENRMGVCQDFAHVAIAAIRALGLPARYVSGYILSQGDGSQPMIGAEASHAWISVYCPEFGWVDFDPTNDQITSEQHIILGWGRDYADVAPSRGSILGGGKQSLNVEVRVRLIN